MLVVGAKLKTKIKWLFRPKESEQGMYNVKMPVARLKILTMRKTRDPQGLSEANDEVQF